MRATTTNRSGFVSIIGRPNVGKSTLLNSILGQKLAITSRKDQTTRHNIVGIKTRPEGQIVFVDTPGVHQRTNHAMNRYLNRTARAAAKDADLVVLVVEALKWTAEDSKALRYARSQGAQIVLVINKIDKLPDKTSLLPFIEEVSRHGDFAHLVPVSAKKGTQIQELENSILDLLPEGENFYPDDQITDRNERFFAAELLREQFTRLYGKELPYALSVETERFQEENDLYRIGAVVWVERASQKAILIGSKGKALKEAATRARREMERFFGCKVFLQVWVKVKKSWSDDESALIRLGYGDHSR